MARLRDVTMQRPTILFVGINPGERSGKIGHHFAGPGNPFWKLLHAAGITPVELRADEDQRLTEFHHGLVNLCTRPTRTAAELTAAELARGARRLAGIVGALEPEVVALVGVTLYPIVCRHLRVAKRHQTPGPGPKPELVAGARLFVVPNPSGLNASFPTFAAKLPWFRQLALYAGLGVAPAPSA